MTRSAITRVRFILVALPLALTLQFLSPHRAFAQPVLSLTKSVSNVTTGSPSGPSVSALPGETLQYSIVYSNTGTTTATPLTIQDAVQPGQTFNGVCSATTPGTTCASAAATLTYTIPSVPGGTSGTAVFQVTVNPTASGTIFNQATASAPGAANAVSNTTYVTVGAPPPCTYAPSCYPPPCTYAPSCYPPPCTYAPSCHPPPTYVSPIYTPSAASILICGVISVYTAATAGLGYMTISGMTFGINPYVVPGGIPFTVGASFCVAITFTAFAQVGALTVSPNVAGVPYVCGNLSQFNPGYNPYPGFNPYPGYNPNPGYGTYPGYGTNPYPGNAAVYGYGGPMMLGGYPFPVAPGTQFPYGFSYGNPYCFLMSAGYVSGAFAVFAVAATPAEDPAGVHRSGRHLAL